MKLRFSVEFKQGSRTITVPGIREVGTEELTIADMHEAIPGAEQLLEKLLGVRVRIDQTN